MKLAYCMALALSLCMGATSVKAVESFSTPTGVLQWDEQNAYNGYTVVSPNRSKSSYLIDMKGNIVHEWKTEYRPGLYAELLPNGNLLRSFSKKDRIVPFGGAGGGVQEFDWEGNIVWQYDMYDAKQTQHHTFERMPNGNTLILGWEHKTYEEAMAKGRKPGTIPKAGEAEAYGQKYGDIWPDFVVEINQKGEEVWSWHAWDHIGTGSKQLDINFKLPWDEYTGLSDWTHFNTIDYIPETDQLILCSRNFGEIYLIDKKTGKIDYRWGNPGAYGKGELPSFLNNGDQKLFGPHSAQWIGDGKIIIFDNGWQRPDHNGSRALILDTKTNKVIWEYEAENLNSFYAAYQGAVQLLPNGNVLITSSAAGHVFEVTQEKEPKIVWEYVTPWSAGKAVALLGEEDATPFSINYMSNSVHRAYRYAPDYPGLKGRNLKNKRKAVSGAPNWLKLYDKARKIDAKTRMNDAKVTK